MRDAKLRKWYGAAIVLACHSPRAPELRIPSYSGPISSAHQIFPRLPLANQRKLIAANQRFRRQRTRIVIRSHHKPVCASAHDGEQIAFMELRHLPIQRKEIA